ncbi:MAG: methionyl-tRNA formyltransferase [Patescibacteria group bacterium]
MIKFAFFGTDTFALNFLTSLKEKGLVPKLIICGEDKVQGRGLKLTPPPVKVWAEENDINFIQPKKLDSSLITKLKESQYDFFLVASYGKIIPEEILNLPSHKTLSIHPSLLPKLRGPSPIQATILEEIEPGVTIIRLDKEIDHGPIIAERKLKTDIWPLKTSALSPLLAELGAELFAEILPDFLAEKIKEKPQDHGKATFTKKIEKNDALIDLTTSAWENYKKILAYDIWPRAFFFTESKGEQLRVVITSAKFEDEKLIIEKVIPQNKKEISYETFLKSIR